MKYILQIFLLLSFLPDCSAQVRLDWSSRVNIIGRTDPVAMKVDALGRTAVAGSSDTSSYIALFDSVGIQQWIYELNSGSFVQDVLISLQGDVYAAGNRNSEDPGGYAAFLMKLDANGILQWNRVFESTSNAMSMLEDSIGQVIIGGQMIDTVQGVKFFISKYNTTGDQLWIQEFGEQNDPYISYIDFVKLKKNQHEELFLAGTVHYGFAADSDKVFISKYSSSGNPEWLNSIYQANLFSDNFTIDADGNATVAFYSTSGAAFNLIQYNTAGLELQSYPLGIISNSISVMPDGSLLTAGDVLDSIQPWLSHPSILKLDATGNLIWQQIYQNYSINGFVADSSGSAYMLSGSGGTMVLQKTDPFGNLLWTIENNDSGLSVYGGRASLLDISANGNIRICGYFCHDNHCNSSHTALIKYHETITGIDLIQDRNDLSVYPNPSAADWTISTSGLDPSDSIKIFLFQSDGKLVREEIYKGAADPSINVKSSGLASGVYILKLMTTRQIFSVRLVHY